MSDRLTYLILSLAPENGSSIGNGAMMALLREQVPGLTDATYFAARDELVEAGKLGRGRGRGGSIFRVAGVADDDNEGVPDFALNPTGEPAARQHKAAGRKAILREQEGGPQVLSYRHDDSRVNNPEVGMVHAGTDPDGEKTTWAYDPHLDPVLNFDSARAGIEKLIDDALASDDRERMKEALQELKRLQAPYLNWTGKAEKTNFEVDTVSLHVH